MRLDGKIAFVTGSTRGIGWATARMFAECGATVILHGRSDANLLKQRGDEIAAIVGGAGDDVAQFCFDLTDSSALQKCYSDIFKRFRRLDVFVNNAGIMQSAVVGMITSQSIAGMLALNTNAAIVALQEAARLMMRHKAGSIVNLVSIMGTQGGEGYSVYSASKAAIIGFTKAASKELAGKNIRVNAVAPGFIRTDMTASLNDEQLRKVAGSIRMGRFGEPEDVAKTVLFLASDLSAYVTGQVIGVDGGMSV